MDDQVKNHGNLDTLTAFLKWLAVSLAGAMVVNHVLDIAPDYMPTADPVGATRYVIIRVLAAIILICSMSLGVIVVDWITKYSWFDELRKGNMAVGLVTAALLLALGLGLAYT